MRKNVKRDSTAAVCSCQHKPSSLSPIYHVYNSLTPLSSVKIFPGFYGTRIFISVFRRIHHWSFLYWTRWNKSV